MRCPVTEVAARDTQNPPSGGLITWRRPGFVSLSVQFQLLGIFLGADLSASGLPQ
jgi:hypothetical protein